MIQLINKLAGAPLVAGDIVWRTGSTYEVVSVPEVSDANDAPKAVISVRPLPRSLEGLKQVREVLAHEFAEVEWQENGRPVYYVLRGIYDLMKIPDDRLPACLSELASALPELRRLNARGVPVPETLTWLDNSRHYVTLAVDGEQQVSVPLTPANNEVERFLDEAEAEDFSNEDDAFPDHQLVLLEKKAGDPAQEYTERTGRHLSLNERMAERTRVELERTRNRGDL